MHMFSPPSGYLSLHEARNELRHAMHQGVPCSKEVEKLRSEGLDVSDHTQTSAAAGSLHEAMVSGDLGLHADLSSLGKPRRLSPQLCQAAIRPKDGTVLTFAYIVRHPMAPFDVSWSVLKQLPQAPLLIEEQALSDLLKKEEEKKASPCHAIGANSGKPRGRPRKIDDVIKALEELDETGEFKSSLMLKQIRDLVQKARPSLANVSIETVRRACHEIGLEFAGSRLSHR